MEVHVGERANTRREIDALVDDASIDALARRVEHAIQLDDVAKLETGQIGVRDRRGQVHFVHPDVVQPLDHCIGAWEAGAAEGGLKQALAGVIRVPRAGSNR